MSHLEDAFAFQVKALSLPVPEREYRFAPDRRWRFDFAWPAHKVALECEGGVWGGGRHTRGKGFIEDCHKYNAAAVSGWLVLRVTAEHIKSGEAVEWARQALGRASAVGEPEEAA